MYIIKKDNQFKKETIYIKLSIYIYIKTLRLIYRQQELKNENTPKKTVSRIYQKRWRYGCPVGEAVRAPMSVTNSWLCDNTGYS